MKPTVYYYNCSDTEPELGGVLTANPDAAMDRPDWRWVLAGQLEREYDSAVSLLGEAEWTLCRTLDPLVATKILPFLYQYNRANSYGGARQVQMKYAGLYWALSLYNNDPSSRYGIEALVLGGATTKQAADAFRVPENYLWWYERLFFDVRDRLNDPLWLDNKVFTTALREVPAIWYRQGILWKILAYVFKWEEVLRCGPALALPDAATNDVVHQIANSRNYENALLVSLTRPINRFSNNSIMEENLRAQEIKLRKVALDREVEMTDEQKTFASYVAPVLRAYEAVVGREEIRAAAATPVDLEDIYAVREHERILQAAAVTQAEEEGVFSDGDYQD